MQSPHQVFGLLLRKPGKEFVSLHFAGIAVCEADSCLADAQSIGLGEGANFRLIVFVVITQDCDLAIAGAMEQAHKVIRPQDVLL